MRQETAPDLERRRSAYRERRTLILLRTGPSAQLIEASDRGLAPRLDYVDLARAIGADLMSYEQLLKPPLADIAAKAPILASSLAAFLGRRRYDAIYATGEDLALRLAPLLRLSGWKGRLVAIVHASASARRRMMLKALADRLDAVVCLSEAQRRVLVDEVGLSPAATRAICTNIDTEFFAPPVWPPQEAEEPFALACGLELRDYPTLLEAARRSRIRFRIFASGYHGVQDLSRQAPPANVSVVGRRLPFTELRAAYAACRLVVVPLIANPFAAGVTSLLEGMSMGKPVVATDSVGIAEYLRGGVIGRAVAPGQPDALAQAVAELWDSPRQRLEIGQRNRAWAEAHASLRTYVDYMTALLDPGGAAQTRSFSAAGA